MEDLFSQLAKSKAPLADRMRPRTLDEFIGQKHVVGPGRLLRRAIEADSLTSSIFFGPPGCGKTTLASIIAEATRSKFVKINAVSTGVKEMRQILEQAETDLKLYGKTTTVLLDECHRWSKSQSDIMLPALSGMEVLRRLGRDIPVLDKSLCHIIASGMFNGIFEIVVHDMPRDQAMRDVDQLRDFYTAGWLKLMGG